jgi:hypothetical protein
MRTRLALVVLALTTIGYSCPPPVLTGLTHDEGRQRSLVRVEGENLGLAKVIWDAGQPGERVIPGSLLGAHMFSVPKGAADGPHPVAVENAWGRSATVQFGVTGEAPWFKPRIDRVSLVMARFDGGTVRPALYVQGANIDVGATVQVKQGSNSWEDVATASHQGLWPEMYGVDLHQMHSYYPITPILHYLALLAVPGDRALGAELEVRVKNLDKQVSAAYPYLLPTGPDTLDSDGDNIPDSWETKGRFDADGTMLIDLPGLGVHPLQPDVLVELDVMGKTKVSTATLSFPPQPEMLKYVQEMFRQAPILNPLGHEGVHLIFDPSQPEIIPYREEITFSPLIPPVEGVTDISDIKDLHFDEKIRGRTHIYAVWARSLSGATWAISDADLAGSKAGANILVVDGLPTQPSLGGDDVVIAFDDHHAVYNSPHVHAAALAHELGHCLGQRHGGDTLADLYKPNYWSVMSYAWLTRCVHSDTWRWKAPTCGPIYWGDPQATEYEVSTGTFGVKPAPDAVPVIAYSHGMGPTLDEDAGNLKEKIGVCGHPADWDSGGTVSTSPYAGDVDDDYPGVNPGQTAGVELSVQTNETVHDFSNWRALDYRGPETGGLVPP